MKILVIADKVSKSLYDNFDRSKYPAVDVIISCGDLPLYYLNFLIDAFNVPCFYVPGNHDDNFTTEYPLGWVSLHQRVVEHKGIVMAGIGGSPFYNGESSFQYTENQMYWKCLSLSLRLRWSKKVAIFVTHTPAFGMGDIKNSHVHRGFKSFHPFLKRHDPSLFLYGHVHLCYGVDRIGIFQNTLLVNGFEHYYIDCNRLPELKAGVAKGNIYSA